MGYLFQLARALRFGVDHGQEDKVRDNLRTEHVAISSVYAKLKDHKEIVEDEPAKIRAVCSVIEAPNGQLSNELSNVIKILTKFEDIYDTECRSSEEMRAGVKEVN